MEHGTSKQNKGKTGRQMIDQNSQAQKEQVRPEKKLHNDHRNKRERDHKHTCQNDDAGSIKSILY